MTDSPSRNLSQFAGIVLKINLALTGCAVLLVGLRSLSWPLLHDSPILFYLSRQISEYGKLPYRDLFDMNMPATYFIHIGLDKISFGSPLALRFIDLVLIGLLSLLSIKLVPGRGKNERIYAVLIFALIYLAKGPRLSFQREFLALIPLASAVICLANLKKSNATLTLFLAGLGFGCAGAIKPHLMFGIPFVLACMLTSTGRRATGFVSYPDFFLRRVPFMAIGSLLPLAATLTYLFANGIHREFYSLWRDYLPLYGQITYGLRILAEGEALPYHLFHLTRGHSRFPLLLLALAALTLAFRHERSSDSDKYHILLIGSLCIAYWIYTCISGQYWYYHWMPMTYWLVLALSSLATRDDQRFPQMFRLAGATILLAWSFMLVQSGWVWLISRDPPEFARARLAEDLSDYLKSRLQPGDSVQHLDWTHAGLAHGLLLANARLATPFVYEFHFYHHVSDPVIRDLKKRFLTELAQDPPRFIVEGLPGPPYLRGPDTSASFDELKHHVESRYRVAHQGPQFIWRKPVTYRVWELLDVDPDATTASDDKDGYTEDMNGAAARDNAIFREYEF